jgi:uncharacterized repeat protein (TIGR01451 family)
LKPIALPTGTRQELASAVAPRALLRARGGMVAAVVLSSMLFAGITSATGVAPGTQINNTAVVSYEQGGVNSTGSASTSFVVDQLVDVAVTWQDAKPIQTVAGSAAQVLLFKVTNTGNGNDSYALAPTALPGTGQDFTTNNCKLYLDADKNGRYSDTDPLYVPGSNDPAITAGAFANVLALCDIPDTAGDGRFAYVKVAATSNTFSGAPGAVKPGANAAVVVVVGLTGGKSSANGTYEASNVNYVFTSTQVVTDKSGGSVATSGSSILYTLTVAPSGGNATGRNLVVTDPMPEHSTYVLGSLVLDNRPLGDSATDNDAGDFGITAANAITVQLGNVAGSANPHIISFKVTIN